MEAALEGVNIPGLQGITIPYLVLGDSRIRCLRTTPWRVEDTKPNELRRAVRNQRGALDERWA